MHYPFWPLFRWLQVEAAVLRQKFKDISGSGYSWPVFSGEEDEEILTEEYMEEFVDHLVEGLEHEKTEMDSSR